MADGSLLLCLASDQLRKQVRWAGGLLLLSGLISLPYEFAPALVALAAALGLIAGSIRLSERVLAGLTLGVVAALYLLAGSWAVAQSVQAPLSLGWVASALAAAAVYLAQQEAPRRRVQRLLVVACAIALLHYVWPWPSVGPAAQLAWLVHPLRARSVSWNLVSESIVIALSLSPSVIVGFAWYHARRGASGGASFARLLVMYGMPTLLLPVMSRSLTGRGGDAAVVGAEMIAALAVLVLVGCAIVFMVRWDRAEQAASWSKRRTALVLAAALVLTLAPWAVGRERPRPWRLGPSTAHGEALFGRALPTWNDAVRSGNSAAEAADLVNSARATSATLVAPVEALIGDATRDSTSPTQWSARVSELNEASRRAMLPYYVTPTELVVRGSQRWLRLDSYRIHSTRRFQANGQLIELFSVRALEPKRVPAARLGLSRDGESRVLVLLDAIDAYTRELQALARKKPARCISRKGQTRALEQAILRCGAILRDADQRGELRRAVENGVVRHELQHQLDAGSPPVAQILRRRASALGLRVPPHINRELSAYLAELTASDGSPHVTLARLLRLALIDERQVDGAAARLALEALSTDGAIEAAFGEPAELDARALRQRAAEAWRRELGSELQTPAVLD